MHGAVALSKRKFHLGSMAIQQQYMKKISACLREQGKQSRLHPAAGGGLDADIAGFIRCR
jgi:hypothetical protein